MDGCVVERIRRQFGRVGIRIDVGEVELEARESQSQLVYFRRTDHRAERQCPVLRRPLDFSARRKSWEYRGTAVQRVALELLLSGPQNAEVYAVGAIEKMIDPPQIPRPPY